MTGQCLSSERVLQAMPRQTRQRVTLEVVRGSTGRRATLTFHPLSWNWRRDNMGEHGQGEKPLTPAVMVRADVYIAETALGRR